MTWTRDLFDRLIAAQAEVAGCELLTADRRMLEHLACARCGR
jgi:PIN domain nuclease of toxin-antitoxin system